MSNFQCHSLLFCPQTLEGDTLRPLGKQQKSYCRIAGHGQLGMQQGLQHKPQRVYKNNLERELQVALFSNHQMQATQGSSCVLLLSDVICKLDSPRDDQSSGRLWEASHAK